MKVREWLLNEDDLLPVLGRTTRDVGHFHYYEVDREGRGKTISTLGDVEDHIHEIINWKVINHGHTHFIVGETKETEEMEGEEEELE